MTNASTPNTNALPKLLRAQLRAARERMGWSQADLADAVGSTYRSVRRWETGMTSPTWHQLELWIKALGYTHLPFYLEPFHVELGVVRGSVGWDGLGVDEAIEKRFTDVTPVLVRLDGTVVLEGSEEPVVRSNQVTEEWRQTVTRWFDAFA